MDQHLEELYAWLSKNGLRDTARNRERFVREQIDELIKQGKVVRDTDGRIYPAQ